MKFILLLILTGSSIAGAAQPCDDFVEQKVTKENALPGAILRVKDVVRTGISAGERGSIPYLRAPHEPGDYLGSGFGAPPGVQLEVLVGVKKYFGIITAVKVKDVASPREGYVSWAELKASTTLIKPSSQPPSDVKTKAPKLKFPDKMRTAEFDSLAAVGKTWYGRSFAQVGDRVWIANSVRTMSPNNVGVLVEISQPLVPGDWGHRGLAKVQTLAGHVVEDYHYNCNPISAEEFALVDSKKSP